MRLTAAAVALSALAAGSLMPGGPDGVGGVAATGAGSVTASALPRSPGIAAAPATGGFSATPNLTVRGAGAAEEAALADALGRFQVSGLALPDVDVQFSDDEADCWGHMGAFEPASWRIVVCSELPFVLTHELAHAWAAANLDDADRNRYIEARDLTNWDDDDVPWDERGVEDAAFVIQQNLMATNPRLSSPTWVERIAAYELLTGSASPLCPQATGPVTRADAQRHRLSSMIDGCGP